MEHQDPDGHTGDRLKGRKQGRFLPADVFRAGLERRSRQDTARKREKYDQRPALCRPNNNTLFHAHDTHGLQKEESVECADATFLYRMMP